MANILQKIVKQTREDLAKRRKTISMEYLKSFAEYQRPRRNFKNALKKETEVSIIAEIKKASPSKGVIRHAFKPAEIVENYQNNGASAISVLTDTPFFQGSLTDLQEVSATTTLPVLRKDFIIDFYQIEEARAWGADAILLIVKITDGNHLYELHDAAAECGLQVLVECYDWQDWARLDFERISMVGVNNRNLETFEVNIFRGIEMLKHAPGNVVRVSESGWHRPEDLYLLFKNGIHSALIGEHFMRSDDPGKELVRFVKAMSAYN